MTSPGRRRAGIDVGGTKCLGVVIDSSGEVLQVERQPTPRDPDQLIAVLATMARSFGDIDAIGVGVPGLITREGVIRASPNLFDVRDLAVGSRLSEQLARRVFVENDATCAAIAEWKSGVAMGRSDVVVVTLGTGIGGGIVADGRVVRGRNGFAGEIGHMIVDPSGPRCPCGLHGCWERFASGSALAARARDLVSAGGGRAIVAAAGIATDVRGEHVEVAAREGDAEALAVIDDFCRWVAIGLANLANVLDPELFVIGGGLASTGDAYLPAIRKWFGQMLYAPELRPHPAIELARHRELAGAIGAAHLAEVEADGGH